MKKVNISPKISRAGAFLTRPLTIACLSALFFFWVILFLPGASNFFGGSTGPPDQSVYQPLHNTDDPVPQTREPDPTPEPSPELTPEPTPESSPDPTDTPPPDFDVTPGFSAPANAVPPSDPVDAGYFSDAAFIGDSLTDGLSIFGSLRTPDFLAYSSATVNSVGTLPQYSLEDGEKVTILQALERKQYGKIYIMLGINQMGYDRDWVLNHYRTMLGQIRELQPNAVIYIQSILPVTRSKSESSESFRIERVLRFNEGLAALAEEGGFSYLDIFSAIAGDDGFLPEEASGDGIHPSRRYYELWCEYLMTHTISEQE